MAGSLSYLQSEDLPYQPIAYNKKNVQKKQYYCFTKMRRVKIFFYKINVDIRLPVQVFLLTLC